MTLYQSGGAAATPGTGFYGKGKVVTAAAIRDQAGAVVGSGNVLVPQAIMWYGDETANATYGGNEVTKGDGLPIEMAKIIPHIKTVGSIGTSAVQLYGSSEDLTVTSSDTSGNTVSFTGDHKLCTGQRLLVNFNGGSISASITTASHPQEGVTIADGGVVFARVVDADTISLHPSVTDAQRNTAAYDLTALSGSPKFRPYVASGVLLKALQDNNKAISVYAKTLTTPAFADGFALPPGEELYLEGSDATAFYAIGDAAASACRVAVAFY